MSIDIRNNWILVVVSAIISGVFAVLATNAFLASRLEERVSSQGARISHLETSLEQLRRDLRELAVETLKK